MSIRLERDCDGKYIGIYAKRDTTNICIFVTCILIIDSIHDSALDPAALDERMQCIGKLKLSASNRVMTLM